MSKKPTESAAAVLSEKPKLFVEESLADACYSDCVKVDMTPAEALILIRCVRYGAAAVSKVEFENGRADAIRKVCDDFVATLLDSLADSVFFKAITVSKR